MNHCGTHKCNCHCRVISIMKVLYNKLKHEHIKDADIVTENLICYAKLKITKCRICFCNLRIFYSSGENNLTRRIPIRLFSKIICDSNGQPRYYCRIIHSIILSEPHFILSYGGNNNTHRLLCIKIGYDTCMKNKNNYGDLKIKLNIRGCTEFE